MFDVLATLKSHDAGGVLYINTIAIRVDETPLSLIEPDIGDAAAGVYEWLHAPYAACLTTGYTWDEVQLRGISGHVFAGSAAAHTVGIAGTLDTGAGYMPREVCGIVGLRTGHSTRSGRGHIAVPGPQRAGHLASPNQWATDSGLYLEKLRALGDALTDGHDYVHTGGIIGAHLSARVWSRKDGVTYDVTSAIARTTPRWLERRQTAP